MLRILGLLCVLAALGVGVALYFHWIEISMINGTDDQTKVDVTINKDKFHEDVNRLKGKSASPQMKGKLTGVQVAQKKITVEHDQGTMTLEVTDSTRIRIANRAAKLADLQPGMRVAVQYAEEGGRRIAQSIDVEKEAP